jgi:hypothetical protein
LAVYELIGWAIVLLPVFAALVNLLVVAPLLGPQSRVASILVGGAVGSSFIGALLICGYVIQSLPIDAKLYRGIANGASIGSDWITYPQIKSAPIKDDPTAPPTRIEATRL